MPRMTDSMANQAGPGPSSFKLAALSANSFHLDSPPFTGTAGPLGEQYHQTSSQRPDRYGHTDEVGKVSSDDVESLSSTLRSHANVRASSASRTPNVAATSRDSSRTSRSAASPQSGARDGGGVDAYRPTATRAGRSPGGEHVIGEGSHSSDDGASRTRTATGSERTSRGPSMETRGSSNDIDVPHWDLDAAAAKQESRARETYSNPDALSHVHNSSLSPPPFSSSSQGPVLSNGAGVAQNSLGTAANGGTSGPFGRLARQREASRPVYTLLSDGTSVNGNAVEDASSSSAADGDAEVDADVDADITYRDRDGEVDGDDSPYVVRSTNQSGSPAKRMPLQSKTKASIPVWSIREKRAVRRGGRQGQSAEMVQRKGLPCDTLLCGTSLGWSNTGRLPVPTVPFANSDAQRIQDSPRHCRMRVVQPADVLALAYFRDGKGPGHRGRQVRAAGRLLQSGV